jgi:hypothetical protein
MAGTITETREKVITQGNEKDPKEILVSLACVGDASAGTVPDATLTGLRGWRFTEMVTIPGAGAAAPDAYTVTLTDLTTGLVSFLSTERSVSTVEVMGGHEYNGAYPKIDGSFTVSVSNIGNENETTIRLKFEKGVI